MDGILLISASPFTNPDDISGYRIRPHERLVGLGAYNSKTTTNFKNPDLQISPSRYLHTVEWTDPRDSTQSFCTISIWSVCVTLGSGIHSPLSSAVSTRSASKRTVVSISKFQRNRSMSVFFRVSFFFLSTFISFHSLSTLLTWYRQQPQYNESVPLYPGPTTRRSTQLGRKFMDQSHCLQKPLIVTCLH